MPGLGLEIWRTWKPEGLYSATLGPSTFDVRCLSAEGALAA